MMERLDNFEETLERGLYRLLLEAGLTAEEMSSPDIEEKWEEFIKDYVADAVVNINEYPEAALGFAAYLGMAVAFHWDADWEGHKNDTYSSYYGSRGFDNMDDHIEEDILALTAERVSKLTSALRGCVDATLALLKHESFELQTEEGFYALVRCYSVFFRIGVSIELAALGYHKRPVA